MKLTQKVDHFIVFESFPSTSYCSQKFLPNKIEKIGWLDVRDSIRDVYIGWVVGVEWQSTKINCGRVQVKQKKKKKKTAWKGGAGPLTLLMHRFQHCTYESVLTSAKHSLYNKHLLHNE